jgi:hypothetical protein
MGGKADPEGCNAPVPRSGSARPARRPENECIKVMGWASNFAQVYDAVEEYEKKEDAEKSDTFWGVKLPNPLPMKGAKVTVKGDYSTTFVRATTGTEADPIMGILTFEEMTYHEKPAELAFLPGRTRPKSRRRRSSTACRPRARERWPAALLSTALVGCIKSARPPA